MVTKKDGNEKNRKEPVSSVVRDLWVLSGNECAWDTCRERLFTEDGAWIGKIAHIVGAEPNSARHDSTWTKDELRAFENLVLLCANHHDRIDHVRSRNQYSVGFLREMKKKHEDRFRLALEQFEQELRDVTAGNLVIHASCLAELLAYQGVILNDAELTNELALIDGFADSVGSLTRAPRQLLAYVAGENQEPTLELAARRFAEPKLEIEHLVDELEHAGMARLWFDDEKNRAFIILMGDALGGVIEYWGTLRDFTKTKHLSMAELLVDLNFSVLD